MMRLDADHYTVSVLEMLIVKSEFAKTEANEISLSPAFTWRAPQGQSHLERAIL